MVLRKILKRLGQLIEKKKRNPYKGKPGNKRRKLDESSYFFNCMIYNENMPGLFQFNYSAFLSASRSVLQYIYEEVDPDNNPNAKRGAKKWYQKAVAKSRVIKFGKDERDENIHFAPVIPNTHVTVVPSEIEAVVENPLAYVGNTLVSGGSQKPEDERTETQTLTKASYKYTSSRWEGQEDLLHVCRMYLDELEAVVKTGIAKGYITL